MTWPDFFVAGAVLLETWDGKIAETSQNSQNCFVLDVVATSIFGGSRLAEFLMSSPSKFKGSLTEKLRFSASKFQIS